MLWLYDDDRALTGIITEFDSITTTQRYREHSEFAATLPLSAYATITAATYCIVGDEPEVYVVERPEYSTKRGGRLLVKGRSATALLEQRTIEWTKTWNDIKAGAMIADMMSAFTGSRALPITFGAGDTVGSAFTLQQSWGNCGDVAIEILAANDLGMRAVLNGTDIELEVFAAADAGISLGEKYGDGTTGRLITDISQWRNYAYVLGEGEGAARELVVIDQTAGNPRRELYVDASDVRKDDVTKSFTVAASTNHFTAAGHGFVHNDQVVLSNLTGSAGVTAGPTYYVRDVTTDTFALASTSGGSQINITTDGTGTVYNKTRYTAALNARGLARLSEVRRLEYVEAEDCGAAMVPGDVAYFDAGVFHASFMATEVETTRAKGAVSRRVSLGDPPARFSASGLRRFI